MSDERFPKWLPTETAEWLSKMEGKLPPAKAEFYCRLSRDERMKEAWEWHDSVRSQLPRYQGGGPIGLMMDAEDAVEMPGKPGNMPPKQRERYLQKVRHHALALAELLEDTCFGCEWDEGKEIDLEGSENVEQEIGEYVASAARFAAAEPEGGNILVAYDADPDGLYQLPFDYPHSHTTGILRDVVEWTYYDDRWGRAGLISSSPIRQSGEKARVTYFSCTFYKRLARHGVEVPFPILATLANVCLALPVEQQVEEDTVRKQVRRFSEREREPSMLPRIDDSDLPF